MYLNLSEFTRFEFIKEHPELLMVVFSMLYRLKKEKS